MSAVSGQFDDAGDGTKDATAYTSSSEESEEGSEECWEAEYGDWEDETGDFTKKFNAARSAASSIGQQQQQQSVARRGAVNAGGNASQKAIHVMPIILPC